MPAMSPQEPGAIRFPRRLRLFHHLPITALALLAGFLPALYPLLAGHVPWRGDGLLHLHRLAQLARAVDHGVLYPRWLPDLAHGFGFPLFNYYAPLSYYLALPLHASGLSLAVALQGSYFLAVATLGAGLFLWTRALFGRDAGLTAAFAGVYAPYILYDVHHRGALPEVWGLAWLSVAFWAMHRLATRPGGAALALAALAYAALMTTHNITALFGTPLLAGYALFLLSRSGRFPPRLKQGSTWLPWAALGLGLGLSAFFWAPAFFEQELVQIHKLTDSANFYYGNNFLAWRDLMAAPRPIDPRLVNPPIPFGLGWIPLALALLGWLPRKRPFAPHARAHRLLLTLAAAAMAAMTLPLSLPLWDALPLLPFVQFPWRFLGPATLFLAVLAGAGAARLPRLRAGRPALLLAALALYALPWLSPGRDAVPPNPTPVDLLHFELETGALGTTSAGDYLPVTVTELPPAAMLLPLYAQSAPHYLIPRLDRARLAADVAVLAASYTLTGARLTLTADSPARVRFLWYAFPGWQAQLNGAPIPVKPDGRSGLLAVDIPAGASQELTVAFGQTPLRRLSGWLSLASLLISAGFALGLAVRRRANGAERAHAPASRPPVQRDRPALVVCLLAGAALVLLQHFFLDSAVTRFSRTAFDGRQVRGIDAPLQVNFGEQLVLLGYDQPAGPAATGTPGSGGLRADGVIDLALYWRALPPAAQEYSVAVHLVDAHGRLHGQSDSYHPAGYPTTRWRANEYARDLHRLAVLPGAPPGTYTLRVYVYEPQSGRRLELRNDAGQPIGNAYTLAQVELGAPRRFPAPSAVDAALRPDAALAPGVHLLGLDALPRSIETGQTLAFTLFWRATAVPAAAYVARLQLVGPDGEPAAEARWSPGVASHPTTAWRPGELVRDGRSFLIPAVYLHDAARPLEKGRYRLELALLDETGRPQAQPVSLALIDVTTPPRTLTAPAFAYPVGASLDARATLAGFDLDQTAPQPGDTLDLTLYWQAAAPFTRAYTVFVHLVGPDGRIVAQVDREPVAGARPTPGWLPGEFISDPYRLQLPPEAPAGPYTIYVGMYDPADGRRLPLVDDDGRVAGDAIRLPIP